MRKKAIYGSLICLLILFQSGCATLGSRRTGDKAAVQVSKLVQSTQSWDGTLLAPYPAGQPEITILRITIPPGTRLDTHQHPVINAGVLLAGELRVVTQDGKTLQLKTGDPIVEVMHTWHYGINEGTVPAEIMVFYAGVSGQPITVKEPR